MIHRSLHHSLPRNQMGSLTFSNFDYGELWALWKQGTPCPLICVFCFYHHLSCSFNLSQFLFPKKFTSCKHSVLPLVTTSYWIYSLDNLVQFSELENIPEDHWFEVILFPLSPILCLFCGSQSFSQVCLFLKELTLW